MNTASTVKVLRGYDGIVEHVGSVLGVSDWLTVDQRRLDKFMQATGEESWSRSDLADADGSTCTSRIVPEFQTLALLPAFADQVYAIEGASMIVNYGLEEARFPAPAHVGSRLRARAVLVDAIDIVGGLRVLFDTTIEIEGGAQPVALVRAVQVVYF